VVCELCPLRRKEYNDGTEAEERRAVRVYQVGLDLTKTNKPTSSSGGGGCFA
jgi:hypothetical protein